MTDLGRLLELTTDEIEMPDLARTALATAHRRRTRRRGTLVAMAASVAVVGVVVVPRAVDSDNPTLPSQDPSPTPSTTPAPDAAERVAPPIGADVIQQPWDPATAGDLPLYPIGHIPTVLAPEGGHSRPGDTVGVLALSRTSNDRLAVLYGERGWYGMKRVYEAGDLWDSALSRDGSRMAIVGVGGLFWCPAAEECPDWRRIDVPDLVLGEEAHLTWTRDPGRLIVSGLDTGYLVDLDSGDTTELPYLGDADFDVAPDNSIVARQLEPGSVAEWDDAERVSVPVLTGELGGLNDLAVFESAIAATRIDPDYATPPAASDGDGLVVLERDGLATRAFLPFTGTSGEWVDGEQVKPVQWLNKVTVLFSVLVDDEVHLVAWNTMTGDLGRVTGYPASYDVSLRELYPS